MLPAFGAQQSVQVTSGQASLTLPNTAPWTTIGLNTNPMRWELRVHDFGTDWPAYPSYLVNLGPFALMKGYAGNVIMASVVMSQVDVVYSNGPQIVGCCTGRGDVLVRVQRDVANSQYILEACNAAGGGCSSATAKILSYRTPSWARMPMALSAGGKIAFIRWFSGVVPVGSPIGVGGVVGDLGDWEFEGNLLDSSGHGINFSGGSAGYSATPSYPPACNAGTQQSFRAGYPAQLDGSGSYPLDGGTFLSYAWQLASGPAGISWSSQNAARPQIGQLVFGSYVLQLKVTDGSGQSSTCTVKDGAVATDDNDIVITSNAAVDTLLGPMVRYGANPWPWYDNRHKQAADNQIAVMDTYYPAWWDVAGPGTVTVTDNSTTVVGSGTSFTTTFCQGPANPTVPQTTEAIIAVWHPLGSGTGRRMSSVVSCKDDTHLTVDNAWNNDGKTPGASGLSLSYGAGTHWAAYYWGWGQTAVSANFYDNVAAYYALYYRSGIDDYLTAARKLADRFWESPPIDQGVNPSPYSYTPMYVSALGLTLRALDGRPDMWAAPAGAAHGGLHTIWNDYMWYLGGPDASWGPGLWDTRTCAYHLAMVSYCALFDADPNYRSACKTAISKSFPAVWTPSMFPDGSWPQLYVGSASWFTLPTTSATLTNGSAAVTGVGTNWSASAFPTGTKIWFTGSPSAPHPKDTANDTVSYIATFVDSHHLTLDRPYQGTTGSHGWEVSNYNAVGWNSQPFILGILSAAFDLAAKAVADVDPATASLAHSYNVASANWIKTYGYWPATKGLYYFVNGIDCQPPIADSNALCTAGNNAGQARTLSAEALRGLNAAYAYTQDPGLKTFNDTLYNAMWARPTTCPAGSTLCVADGAYIDPMDDGGYMISGSPPPDKWFGMFFGFSAQSSWPGYRVGEGRPAAWEPMYTGTPVVHSVQVTSGQASLTLPNTAPWTTIGSNTNPMRWELRVHDFGTD
ncbi:MAG: hypothetical protein ABSH20_24425, partial [Tepidisphaeraceae bacterium]